MVGPTKQCQGPKKPDCVQCREMVKDWYDEIQDYIFDTGKSNGGVISHFTQVVWKETTDLGMATAKSADKFITVARYRSKGNIDRPEDYIKNVPKPLSTRAGANGSSNPLNNWNQLVYFNFRMFVFLTSINCLELSTI